MRTAEIFRKTRETDLALTVNLDGQGIGKIQSGIGFLDHMLELFSRHSGIDLTLSCKGDREVDDHHSTEDIGIALGEAVRKALGEKRGICRYGSLTLPMDEALILCALDISGRGGFYPELPFPSQKIGSFDTELVEEFMTAFAIHAGITLHIRLLAGRNSHHIAEGCFKALARALREGIKKDERFQDQIPSTKGIL